MDTIDLSSQPSASADVFVGVTSDFLFDRIVFNEDSGGDDIAIADVRFAVAVAPEPISSTLFIIGACALGMRRFWKKRNLIK